MISVTTKKFRVYNKFLIHFEYDEDIISEVKKMSGATYNSKLKYWSSVISQESCLILDRLLKSKGYKQVSDEVFPIIEKYKKNAYYFYNLSSSVNPIREEYNIKTSTKKSLYSFQQAGVEYMLKSKRCINADDMGLGKTIQTIAAIKISNALPAIIICPSIAVDKWRKEFKEWTPEISTQKLSGNLADKSDVYILNYEQVSKYKKFLKSIKAKTFVLDESHKAKDSKSINYENSFYLAEGADYRYLLSGTFVENKAKELIPQLKILDRLQDFGGYTSFVKSYCGFKIQGERVDISESKNLLRLHKRLRSICMIRRLKKDVKKDLLGKSQPILVNVKISNSEEYSIAEKNPVKWIYERKRKEQDKIALNLFPITKKEKILLDRDAMELEIVAALKNVSAKGKLEDFYKWLDFMMKRKKKEKFVIFSSIIEIQKSIQKKYNCLSILGSHSSREKTEINHIFESEEENRVIVCSLKAANYAIDLVSANNVIFIDFGWTSTIHEQAEDRCNRIGQKKFVNCYYIVGKDTIDETLFHLIQKKKNLVSQIQDGIEVDEKQFSISEELKQIIKEKYAELCQ